MKKRYFKILDTEETKELFEGLMQQEVQKWEQHTKKQTRNGMRITRKCKRKEIVNDKT